MMEKDKKGRRQLRSSESSNANASWKIRLSAIARDLTETALGGQPARHEEASEIQQDNYDQITKPQPTHHIAKQAKNEAVDDGGAAILRDLLKQLTQV